jgi:hypothetical protein
MIHLIAAHVVVPLEKCQRCHNLFTTDDSSVVAAVFNPASNVINGDVKEILSLSLEAKQRIKEALREDEIVQLTPERAAALDIENCTVPMKGTDHVGEEIPTPVGIYCPACLKSYIRSAMPAENRWYVVVRGQEFTGIVRGTALYEEYTLGVVGASVPAGRRKFATKEDAEFNWRLAYYSGQCTEVTWKKGVIVAKSMLPHRMYAKPPPSSSQLD